MRTDYPEPTKEQIEYTSELERVVALLALYREFFTAWQRAEYEGGSCYEEVAQHNRAELDELEKKIETAEGRK